MLMNQGTYVRVHKSSLKSYIHPSLKEEGTALTFRISIICQLLLVCSMVCVLVSRAFSGISVEHAWPVLGLKHFQAHFLI